MTTAGVFISELKRARLAAIPVIASLLTAPSVAKDSVEKARAVQEKPAADCVILLHGLTRSPASMRKLERHLRSQGYDVVNQGYDSRSDTIQALAAPTIDVALSQCPDTAPTVNFVTHSLGGILLRQYLAEKQIKRLGRVVMLGPPNQGSEVTDRLGDVPGFDLINGPAGEQLGTGEDSVPVSLGPANFDVGIIAGTNTINLFLSRYIPGENDGKVSVEHTKLAGMRDHIALPVSHPFLMRDKDALYQTTLYLKTGAFDHENADRPDM